jgi:hypothetical protein
MKTGRWVEQYLLLLACALVLVGLCRLQWLRPEARRGDLARGDGDDGQAGLDAGRTPMAANNWPIRVGRQGPQTFMVFMAPDGRLQRIEPCWTWSTFARIQPGKSDQDSCCV